ncbi:hypothetical protein C5U48_09110, partial [Mycolicibacter virginiensis]
PLGSSGAAEAADESEAEQLPSASRAAAPAPGNAASAAEPQQRRRSSRESSSDVLHAPGGRNGRQTAHYQR